MTLKDIVLIADSKYNFFNCLLVTYKTNTMKAILNQLFAILKIIETFFLVFIVRLLMIYIYRTTLM